MKVIWHCDECNHTIVKEFAFGNILTGIQQEYSRPDDLEISTEEIRDCKWHISGIANYFDRLMRETNLSTITIRRT